MFAFREMMKFVNAGDNEGLSGLSRAGRIGTLAGETSVKILQHHEPAIARAPAYEVRVMDGDAAGKAVWIPGIQVYRKVEARTPAKPARKRRR